MSKLIDKKLADYINDVDSSLPAPRPVVFLKSDTTLNGSGTESDPYTLS